MSQYTNTTQLLNGLWSISQNSEEALELIKKLRISVNELYNENSALNVSLTQSRTDNKLRIDESINILTNGGSTHYESASISIVPPTFVYLLPGDGSRNASNVSSNVSSNISSNVSLTGIHEIDTDIHSNNARVVVVTLMPAHTFSVYKFKLHTAPIITLMKENLDIAGLTLSTACELYDTSTKIKLRIEHFIDHIAVKYVFKKAGQADNTALPSQWGRAWL
jgi:hypothetical protein